MVVAILLAAALAGQVSVDQPMVALVDRQSVTPNLYDYAGIVISPDTLLVVIPYEDSKLLGSGLNWIGSLPEKPLWIVRRDRFAEEKIPSEMVFLKTETSLVISASQDAVEQLREEWLFVVSTDLVPVSRIVSPGIGEGLIERLLADKPRHVRWPRAGQIANSVDPNEVRKNLRLLCYDPISGGPSARFSCRDELRETYAPLIFEKIGQYVSPGGGTVDTMMFQIAECGEKHLINIVGSKRGRRTSAFYLICAHYDATGSLDQWDWRVDPSPGANDNASGVAALLECARILGGVDLDVGLKVVAFSGEEQGLRGSADYVKKLTEADSIIGVVNFDMIGWLENQREAAKIGYDWKSKWLADLLKEAKDSLAIDDLHLELELQKVALTSDHGSFWIKGIPGVWLTEKAKDYPYYHTKADTAGNVNIAQVCDLIKLVSGLLGFFISVEGEGKVDLVLQEGNVELDWPGRIFQRQALLGDTVTATVRAVNQGLVTEVEEPYLFEIWDGMKGQGELIDRDTVFIQVASGMLVEIKRSWKIEGATGRRFFTFGLFPLNQGVEENTDNNQVTVELLVASKEGLMIKDFHVFPNPVTDESSIKIGFLLLYPGTSLFATMDVAVYDIMGNPLMTKSFEKSGTKDEFVIGENTIDLGDVLAVRDLAPGLYQIVASVRSLAPGRIVETSKARASFAVIR